MNTRLNKANYFGMVCASFDLWSCVYLEVDAM